MKDVGIKPIGIFSDITVSSGEGPPNVTGITLTSNEIQEGEAVTVGKLLMVGGTEPSTFTLLAGSSSALAIVGDELQADGTQVEGSLTANVRVTDWFLETFTDDFTIAVAAEPPSNDSGIGSGDGGIVTPDPEDPETDQSGFVDPPIQQNTSEGLKVAGKNGGSATWFKSLSLPEAGGSITFSYQADWSGMSKQGRDAAVGFAFKQNNSYHLTGVRGDGATPTVMRASRIYGDFRKANQFTVTDDTAATGTVKDGPNFLRLSVSTDGETYTLAVGSSIGTLVDVETGRVPQPMGGVDDALEFGIGGYFTNQDKGVFLVTVTLYVVAPAVIEEPIITGNAWVGQTLTVSQGTWTQTPDSYTYQWKRDGVNISGATSSTYALVSADAGTAITCRVTALKGTAPGIANTINTIDICADEYFDNVILLMSFDGADGATTFRDESKYASTFGAGNQAKLATGIKKFGTASLALDGVDDYIWSAPSSRWQLGSQPFTMDAWCYFPTGANPLTGDFSIAALWSTSTNRSWQFSAENGDPLFRYRTAAGVDVTVGLNLNWISANNTWYHIRAERDPAGWMRLYLNGVMHTKVAIDPALEFLDMSTLRSLLLGVQADSVDDFWGNMDDIRITKGVARCANDAGFTPPTEPWPRAKPFVSTTQTLVAANQNEMLATRALVPGAGSGTGSYDNFELVGDWPAGLSIDTAGKIKGVPTAAGTYPHLSVKLTDDNGGVAYLPPFDMVVGTNAAVWQIIGYTEVDEGDGNTITIQNVPIGPEHADRRVLLSIGWSKYASGNHEIGSLTLGGVSGTRVIRGQTGFDTEDAEHWLFLLGDISGETASLVWVKAGGAATPTWQASIVSHYYASEVGRPLLLESSGNSDTGTNATVTATQAGQWIVTFADISSTQGIDFTSTPDFPEYLITYNSFSTFRYLAAIHGTNVITGSLTVTMNSFRTTNQAIASSLWSREATGPRPKVTALKSAVFATPKNELVTAVKNGVFVKPANELVTAVKTGVFVKPENELVTAVKTAVFVKPV